MKIENIIEDIKRDITALKDKLEEQFRKENPGIDFIISIPGIEELTTIKSLALLIKENNTIYYLSVHIHTHNGNRVFENTPRQIINNQPLTLCECHPLQDRFVDLLRDIIKKNKNKTRSDHKSGDFYDDAMQYTRRSAVNASKIQ